MFRANALVAYERMDGSYDVHRSSYLGHNLGLVGELTPSSPYGRREVCHQPPLVEPYPVETGVSLQQLLDRLDFSRFSVVVEVSTSFEVTAYLAAWFGLEEDASEVYASDAVGNGALVDLELSAIRSLSYTPMAVEFTSTKETLGRLIDDGVLAPHDARNRLIDHVRSYERDGHTVHLPSWIHLEEPSNDRSRGEMACDRRGSRQ